MIYRAKRKDNGELIKGYYVHDADMPRPNVIYCNGQFIAIDHTTLAMATGIQDKNGTMIYGSVEVDGKLTTGGDNVKWIFEYESYMPDSEDYEDRSVENKGAVYFDNAAFYVTDNSLLSKADKATLEIVNQFDNIKIEE